MPPNRPKKFRHFLERRHHRHKKSRASLAHWFTLADPSMSAASIRKAGARALLVPALTLFVYALLALLDLFTLRMPVLHVAALVLFLFWVVWAVRGALGFWSHRAHLRFALPLFTCVVLGASWGGFGPVPVKAWITPPPYARLPSEPLGDPALGAAHDVLEGSLVHIVRQETGAPLSVDFAGRTEKLEYSDSPDVTMSFSVPLAEVHSSAAIVVRRKLHRLAVWPLKIMADKSPSVVLTEAPEITSRKTIRFAYDASDDYGVESLSVRVAPTTPTPDVDNAPVEIILATPDTRHAQGASYADLTSLPWAGVSATVQLIATDGAGHKGWSAPKIVSLPARTFHNPFAKALIEEREKLLHQPDAQVRDEIANVMAGIARQQKLFHGDAVVLLTLRSGAVRLVLNDDPETTPAIAQILWQTAVRLEEGAVGLARANLATAESDLSALLARSRRPAQEAHPFVVRLHDAMKRYFEALESERARQPPALQEVDWPLATASEMLTPEDLQGRLSDIDALLDQGDHDGARLRLAQLQALIESLRTTPPELTPAQLQIVQQVSALRALARGQKTVAEETEKLVANHDKTENGRKSHRDRATRNLAAQQLLAAALVDAIGKTDIALNEVKSSETAMRKAIAALQKGAWDEAQARQAEALALLQNALGAISEQMRLSLSAKVP